MTTVFYPGQKDYIQKMNDLWDRGTLSLTGTSTSSVLIGTGTKSFTTDTQRQWAVGAPVLAMRTSNPTGVWIYGTVTSYDPDTGALVMNSTVTSGSGTYTDWTITVSGVRGATGSTGAAGLTHRGAWASATAYVVNDAATYGGGTYRRKVAGTTATNPSADATNWELLAAKGDPGNTGPANTLTIGTVTTGAAGSSAAATVTGTAPNQTLNLTIPQGIQGIQGDVGPAGLVWKGAWVSGTTYAINDAVTNSGSSFRRKVAGAGTTAPGSDATNWELIAQKGADGTGNVSTVNNVAPVGGNVTLTAANVGALPTTGGTLSGNLVIAAVNGTLVLQDTDTASPNQTTFMSMRDSGNVERGWVGFGAGNGTLGVYNSVGEVTLDGTAIKLNGKVITLGGNLTTAGAFASTFTMTGATSVTFPTSGTLLSSSVSNTLTNGNDIRFNDGTQVEGRMWASGGAMFIQAGVNNADTTGVITLSRNNTTNSNFAYFNVYADWSKFFGNVKATAGFTSTAQDGLRIKTNDGTAGKAMILRNDGTFTYFLMTNDGDADGTWNSLRPVRFNMSNGDVTMDHNLTVAGTTYVGGVLVSKVDTAGAVAVENTSSTTARYPSLTSINYSGGFGGHPVVELITARGTKAAPASVAAGDILGGFNTWGHNGTANQSATRIQGYAATTFSSAVSAGLDFFVTNGGVQTSQMRLMDTGKLLLGTTTDNGSGARVQVNGALSLTTALAPAYGGTGQASYTIGDILYADTTTTLAKLAANTAGRVLVTNGAGTAPSWQPLDLSFLTTSWTKKGCRVATTANLTASYASNVLTNTGTLAALSIDGVALANGNRVLVKDQATPSHNGIYYVSNVGSVSVAWTLTRVPDCNFADEMVNATVSVEEGTQYGLWRAAFKSTDTVGTTAFYWYKVLDTSSAYTKAEVDALGGGGAMVLLSTATLGSDVAQVDYLTAFSSTYDTYIVHVQDAKGSAPANWIVRLAVGGVVDSTSPNYSGLAGIDSTGTGSDRFEMAVINHNTAYADVFALTFNNVNSSNLKHVGFKGMVSRYNIDTGGWYSPTGAVSGFRLYLSSGNVKAGTTVRIYGVKKS